MNRRCLAISSALAMVYKPSHIAKETPLPPCGLINHKEESPKCQVANGESYQEHDKTNFHALHLLSAWIGYLEYVYSRVSLHKQTHFCLQNRLYQVFRGPEINFFKKIF